jgi:hypothetical protein
VIYVSTAGVTGFFILLAGAWFLFRPGWLHQPPALFWPVLMAGLFVTILATSPRRKGVAVAWDWYFENIAN